MCVLKSSSSLNLQPLLLAENKFALEKNVESWYEGEKSGGI